MVVSLCFFLRQLANTLCCLSLPQEHYLPYIIQSKLKLWCLDGTDRGLNSFLEQSLQNESSRLMLESRYPEYITMAFIVKGDLDRAQYYLSLSLRAFQQVSINYCICTFVPALVYI